jgi:hypothetical protein
MSESPPFPSAPNNPAGQAPTHCVQCGAPDFSKATNLPVCEPCRQALVKRPFPGWVKASAAAMFVLLIISVVQLPARWSQAVVLKHGEKLAHAGKWDDAHECYHSFQNQALSTEDVPFSLDYCEAAAMSGHLRDAVAILDHLNGKNFSNVEIDRAHRLEQTIASKASAAVQPTPPLRTHPPLPPSSTAFNKDDAPSHSTSAAP